jgi:hypothetical protein
MLGQHQASSISITHHASRLRVICVLVSGAAAAFKRPRPQTLPMCPLQASPQHCIHRTTPHHTTTTTTKPWLAQLD